MKPVVDTSFISLANGPNIFKDYKNTNLAFLLESESLGQYWKFLKIIKSWKVEVSNELFEGFIAKFTFTTCSLMNISKQSFLKSFQCLDKALLLYFSRNMKQEKQAKIN